MSFSSFSSFASIFHDIIHHYLQVTYEFLVKFRYLGMTKDDSVDYLTLDACLSFLSISGIFSFCIIEAYKIMIIKLL